MFSWVKLPTTNFRIVKAKNRRVFHDVDPLKIRSLFFVIFYPNVIQVLYALQTLESFSELPLHMQQDVCRVAWLQRYRIFFFSPQAINKS